VSGGRDQRLSSLLGISQQSISRYENGSLGTCSAELLERWAASLGGYLHVEIRVNGQRPLTDARHAALQTWLVGLLVRFGWEVAAEVSFNHYGDRGRVDVLAYHLRLRILVIFEIKTRIDDVQDLLGRLDVKVRLGREIARQRGWNPTAIVPALVIRAGSTNRRRIDAHGPLFARFRVRSSASKRWLTRPTLPVPAGLLLFQRDPRQLH
jgi:transcriptional regulator with XRE-family HTH domain